MAKILKEEDNILKYVILGIILFLIMILVNEFRDEYNRRRVQETENLVFQVDEERYKNYLSFLSDNFYKKKNKSYINIENIKIRLYNALCIINKKMKD